MILAANHSGPPVGLWKLPRRLEKACIRKISRSGSIRSGRHSSAADSQLQSTSSNKLSSIILERTECNPVTVESLLSTRIKYSFVKSSIVRVGSLRPRYFTTPLKSSFCLVCRSHGHESKQVQFVRIQYPLAHSILKVSNLTFNATLERFILCEEVYIHPRGGLFLQSLPKLHQRQETEAHVLSVANIDCQPPPYQS